MFLFIFLFIYSYLCLQFLQGGKCNFFIEKRKKMHVGKEFFASRTAEGSAT